MAILFIHLYTLLVFELIAIGIGIALYVFSIQDRPIVGRGIAKIFGLLIAIAAGILFLCTLFHGFMLWHHRPLANPVAIEMEGAPKGLVYIQPPRQTEEETIKKLRRERASERELKHSSQKSDAESLHSH